MAIGWTRGTAGVTVGDWWARWWSGHRASLRATTQAQHESVARSLILPTFETRRIGAVTQPDVQAWVTEMHAQAGKSPATVRKAYQVFAAAMSAAVDAGLISKTPCREVSLPAQQRGEALFLTTTQVADLAEAIHPRYRALVLVAAYGGLRIGELAGLRVRRFDLKGRVQVAETLVEVRGHLITHAPKTPPVDVRCRCRSRWRTRCVATSLSTTWGLTITCSPRRPDSR